METATRLTHYNLTATVTPNFMYGESVWWTAILKKDKVQGMIAIEHDVNNYCIFICEVNNPRLSIF